MSNTKVSSFFPTIAGYTAFAQKHQGVSSNSIEELFQQDTFDILNMMVPSYSMESSSQQPITNEMLNENGNNNLTGAKRSNSSLKNEKKNTKRRKTSLTDQPSSPYNSEEEESNSGSVDEKKLKRQKRLVKNREAAQLFRQRQKNYIQDLEKKVEGLISENHQFTSKAELLESENRLLRDQLTYLRGFLSQIMTMAFPVQAPAFNFPSGTGPSTTSSILSNTSTNDSSASIANGSNLQNLFQHTSEANTSMTQTESNPAHSVAAAFQAAMGFSNPNTQSHNMNPPK